MGIFQISPDLRKSLAAELRASLTRSRRGVHDGASYSARALWEYAEEAVAQVRKHGSAAFGGETEFAPDEMGLIDALLRSGGVPGAYGAAMQLWQELGLQPASVADWLVVVARNAVLTGSSSHPYGGSAVWYDPTLVWADPDQGVVAAPVGDYPAAVTVGQASTAVDAMENAALASVTRHVRPILSAEASEARSSGLLIWLTKWQGGPDARGLSYPDAWVSLGLTMP